MKVYIYDILVKYHTREDHIDSLHQVLERAEKYKLWLNPKKCVFGVSSGKLLGFIVNNRGIQINPVKVKALVDMSALKNLKDLRWFLG